MSYYLSTETIKAAYNELILLKYSNQSILHIFFILKGIGINNIDYIDASVIKHKGIPYAQDLGALFSSYEKQPKTNDFINPFMMNDWGMNPSEKLEKWVKTRIKNNVIGGATTWRKIIMQDADSNFKFSYDYMREIKELTIGNSKRIPLISFAIWSNRFTEFEKHVTIRELESSILKRFNINDLEKKCFFKSESSISTLFFDNKLHCTEDIRKMIGSPSGLGGWEVTNPVSVEMDLFNTTMRRFEMGTINEVSKDMLMKILKDYHQLILSGPPGTSKSYLCSQLATEYTECLHIQFHPQYSYQQFVGGYVVDKADVVYRSGIMLDLIEKANKALKDGINDKYLVIIDEINRANTSQVFGDLVQCLDRGTSVEILCDGQTKKYTIPKNIHIIGTMNTTDRTIGILDYALKRRFLMVYCASNPQILTDLCSNNGFISLCDFLEKINNSLYENLKNREYCIGHAIFLNDVYHENGKFVWDFEKFEILFNYKILPLIEEYCYGQNDKVVEILGEDLCKRLSGDSFIESIQEYMK